MIAVSCDQFSCLREENMGNPPRIANRESDNLKEQKGSQDELSQERCDPSSKTHTLKINYESELGNLQLVSVTGFSPEGDEPGGCLQTSIAPSGQMSGTWGRHKVNLLNVLCPLGCKGKIRQRGPSCSTERQGSSLRKYSCF